MAEIGSKKWRLATDNGRGLVEGVRRRGKRPAYSDAALSSHHNDDGNVRPLLSDP